MVLRQRMSSNVLENQYCVMKNVRKLNSDARNNSETTSAIQGPWDVGEKLLLALLHHQPCELRLSFAVQIRSFHHHCGARSGERVRGCHRTPPLQWPAPLLKRYVVLFYIFLFLLHCALVCCKKFCSFHDADSCHSCNSCLFYHAQSYFILLIYSMRFLLDCVSACCIEGCLFHTCSSGSFSVLSTSVLFLFSSYYLSCSIIVCVLGLNI